MRTSKLASLSCSRFSAKVVDRCTNTKRSRSTMWSGKPSSLWPQWRSSNCNSTRKEFWIYLKLRICLRLRLPSITNPDPASDSLTILIIRSFLSSSQPLTRNGQQWWLWDTGGCRRRNTHRCSTAGSNTNRLKDLINKQTSANSKYLTRCKRRLLNQSTVILHQSLSKVCTKTQTWIKRRRAEYLSRNQNQTLTGKWLSHYRILNSFSLLSTKSCSPSTVSLKSRMWRRSAPLWWMQVNAPSSTESTGSALPGPPTRPSRSSTVINWTRTVRQSCLRLYYRRDKIRNRRLSWRVKVPFWTHWFKLKTRKVLITLSLSLWCKTFSKIRIHSSSNNSSLAVRKPATMMASVVRKESQYPWLTITLNNQVDLITRSSMVHRIGFSQLEVRSASLYRSWRASTRAMRLPLKWWQHRSLRNLYPIKRTQSWSVVCKTTQLLLRSSLINLHTSHCNSKTAATTWFPLTKSLTSSQKSISTRISSLRKLNPAKLWFLTSAISAKPIWSKPVCSQILV